MKIFKESWGDHEVRQPSLIKDMTKVVYLSEIIGERATLFYRNGSLTINRIINTMSPYETIHKDNISYRKSIEGRSQQIYDKNEVELRQFKEHKQLSDVLINRLHHHILQDKKILLSYYKESDYQIQFGVTLNRKVFVSG